MPDGDVTGYSPPVTDDFQLPGPGDRHDEDDAGGFTIHVCCTYLRQFKQIKVHLEMILTKY